LARIAAVEGKVFAVNDDELGRGGRSEEGYVEQNGLECSDKQRIDETGSLCLPLDLMQDEKTRKLHVQLMVSLSLVHTSPYK
jgi:hypothetical protein